MTKEPLKVTLPLGIGDCHWACMKLKGLSEYHDNRPIHTYTNSDSAHKSDAFLDLVPFVDKSFHSRTALAGLLRDMQPHHRHPKWSTLEGCRNWREYDYILCPNGHLETGKSIETWLPELETVYQYEFQITDEQRESGLSMVEDNPTVLYFAGNRPNRAFHGNTWKTIHWREVIRLFNEHDITPYVVGAPGDDVNYAKHVEKFSDIEFHNLTGKTSVAEVISIIESASVFGGFNSGLPIVSAMRQTPTLMLWINSEYKNPGVRPHAYLPPEMQTSWLNEEQLKTYRTLSFGSPELTPKNVFEIMMEIKK